MAPQYGIAYYHLGRAYTKKDFVDKAISVLEKLVEINPRDSDAFFHLGYSYAKNGKDDMAIGALQKALNLNPGDEAAKDIMKQLMR